MFQNKLIKLSFFLCVSALILFLSSCNKEYVLSYEFLVTPTTISNGDTIMLQVNFLECNNVEPDIIFYWDGEEIGHFNSAPYQMEYVVNDAQIGIHQVECYAYYSEGNIFSDVESSSNIVRNVIVIE